MIRKPTRACAGVFCVLVLGAAAEQGSFAAPEAAGAGAPTGPAAKNAASGPSAPTKALPPPFSLNPRQLRAQVRGGHLIVRAVLPERSISGRLTARALDLYGRVLGTAREVLPAARGERALELRLPLGRDAGPNADLLRLSWRFEPLSGKATEGVVALSEILDVPFLSVRGQESLVAGCRAALRVSVKDQRGRPLPEVKVSMLLQAGARSLLAKGVSSQAGELHLAVDLPESWAGVKARLAVEASAGPFRRSYRAGVEVRREAQLLLTLDKPIYQPGQAIHVRTLALRQPSRLPLAGRAAVFRVRDPRGTLLVEHKTRTDEFGVAFATLPLSDGVRPGTFSVEAEVNAAGRHQVEKSLAPAMMPAASPMLRPDGIPSKKSLPIPPPPLVQ